MKKYEAVIILEPTLEEKSIEDEINKITSLIEKDKGEIIDTDKWGIKNLTYPINHKDNGYYIVVYFRAENEAIKEMDRVNRINDNVLRHIIFKSTKQD